MMADVRCPMCSKSNPANAETCQYCGARLKLVTSRSETSPSDQSKPRTGKSPGAESDWLGSLRGEQNAAAGPAGKPPIRDVFVPGPLSKDSAGSTNAGEAASPDEDFSDWLSRISQDTPADETTEGFPVKASGSSETGETEDWLSNLRGIPGSEQDKIEPSASSLSGSTGQEEADWLGRLDASHPELASDSAASVSTPGESAAPEEDLPAWLKELSGASKPAQPSPSASSDLPDWFDNLTPAQPVEPSQKESPGTRALSDSDLSKLEQKSPMAEEPAKQPEEPGWESAEPDWITGAASVSLSESTHPVDRPVEGQGQATWETELPDWLSSPAAPAEAAPEEKTDAGSAWNAELPDWLSGMAPVEPGVNSIQSGAPAANLSSAETGSPIAETPAAGSQTEKPIAVESELPDWMSNLKPLEAAEPGEPSQTPALITDESPITGEQAEVRPFVTEEMPDWLVHLGPPEVISSVSPTPEPAAKPRPSSRSRKKAEEDASLAPADLPSWVQAMRPIETATPSVTAYSDTDERVENTGPLAGVRGILPAEPLLSDIRKPPVYSVKLQVSEKQRSNAALMQTLLTVETEPQKVAKTRPYLTQRILRLAIALVLILAAWVPIWIGGPLTPQPTFLRPQTEQFKTSINAIPSGAPVLVAVEYEPGLSGELETISSNVIAQLMARSANLVFITTNPAGSILADNLLNRALTLQPNYSAADKVANLKYLAGGPTALFNFSLALQSLDPLQAGLAGDWSKPPLNGIKALSDFSSVLVLTDNADTARAWVEQVKPSMGKTPLLMVASAQSEPMISPYLDSGQISGMITGLTGGALYEQAVNQPVHVQNFWDSYQAGLIIIVALILIGGLISIWNLLRSSRRPRGEA